MAGGQFVQHRVKVLRVIPDQLFHHGGLKRGQLALASLAGSVLESGWALGLPVVKPMINRDAANRENTGKLLNCMALRGKQQALAPPTSHLIRAGGVHLFQLSRLVRA